MGDYNYSTALSHVVLAGSSIYCLMHHQTDMGILCFGQLASYSLLGLWRWGNPEAGSFSKSTYDVVSKCQEITVLGCVAAELWTSSNVLPHIWWTQIVVPLVPLVFYFLDINYKDLAKIALVFNAASNIYVSITNKNWWASAATVSFLWGMFCVKNQRGIRDIPAVDLMNYELSFFSYFALKALKGF